MRERRINVQRGATGNTLKLNSMHGNGTADARDLDPLVNDKLPNDWIKNDRDTDSPPGAICGVR